MTIEAKGQEDNSELFLLLWKLRYNYLGYVVDERFEVLFFKVN